jgi:hypothetical protein
MVAFGVGLLRNRHVMPMGENGRGKSLSQMGLRPAAGEFSH